MSKEMLNALDALETEKGIAKEIVIEALEAALVSAYKRNYSQAQNVEVEFDMKKGNIHVYAVKEVVEVVFDSRLEVSIEDALELNKAYEIGDKIRFEVTPKDFGRIAAQTAKQVIMQRVREAERSIIYNEFVAYENDIMQGIVERQDNRYIYVNLGKIEAVLSKQEQIPNETYKAHDRIKVYVTKVENTSKGPQIFVSRSHPDLLKRLFEQEVPEIYDGTVEIVSIAREAGDRAKVAVMSRDANIDPVGTCVGPKGQRVQAIVNELKGENMDIVEWNENPATYIANALNPAQVVDVTFNEAQGSCVVVVPDYQLSLAIGKRGQNARLAAKLTGFKIDIKSESDMAALAEVKEETDLETVAEYVEAVEENMAVEAENDAEEVLESIEDLEESREVSELDSETEEDILNPEDAEELIELAEEQDGVDE
ncbi:MULTISPECIES: transcription termination factor NusA [Carnobacterium]|jgi:N utilization substance protein A|uniref:Transcription termination/antitermination protein NusA n=1 Tax=Carnobacterium maltaromaticum LMA28 TaxID=1234679 RepID=K8E4H2_CARML|nr:MULTISPECIES: transcription termination factor NusA [Carnobacterium]AOA02195.1 transcription termination/antitermination protein NusA [Carnobacterium maltaromaticum]KRN65741.1 transcription elongation factor NusA [Carnobacterium maltaromaticum DSM 20342]KRN72423.1 transcription elongation factor NusA [Carnobacterium maltaromaticum]KRN87962.1 transcription elongation factor NusA [Carnobacterium maltaromaticum]MBC9788560.1 transcription termination/antitermination protein NusA [Carnobacterium